MESKRTLNFDGNIWPPSTTCPDTILHIDGPGRIDMEAVATFEVIHNDSFRIGFKITAPQDLVSFGGANGEIVGLRANDDGSLEIVYHNCSPQKGRQIIIEACKCF